MSDDEKFPWIPKFDRDTGIIRVSPLVMRLLNIKKTNKNKKQDIFDIIIKRRKDGGN